MAEASKHQTKLSKNLCHESSESLRVKKYPGKSLEKLCAEKRSVTSNNRELYQRCKYYNEIETANYKLQSRIDSLSTNIEITRCQANEVVVVKS